MTIKQIRVCDYKGCEDELTNNFISIKASFNAATNINTEESETVDAPEIKSTEFNIEIEGDFCSINCFEKEITQRAKEAGHSTDPAMRKLISGY